MPKRSRKLQPKAGPTTRTTKFHPPARDANQAAFDAVQRIIQLSEGVRTPDGKDPLAVALGRRGGLKGGKARVAKMTKEELRESAQKAAQARWAKKR